jgi:tripartite ATP-independent transporter DctM subunit
MSSTAGPTEVAHHAGETSSAFAGSGPGARGRAALIESWAATAVLVFMTALPVAQAFARKLLGHDLPGSSVYVQHGTLWIGFIGALLATTRGKHLGLSTLDLLPEGPWRRGARLFGAMVTSAVVSILCYASVVMILADRTRQDTLAGGLPEWWTEAIMPVALAAMAVTSVWRAPEGWRGRLACAFSAAVAFALGLLQAHAESLVWPVVVLIVVAFLCGAPVFVAMSGIAMTLFFADGTSVAAVPTVTFTLVASSTLPAIPLLTLAGYVLSEGGSAQRLVAAFKSVFGWMPGGLAIMVVAVCAIFTTFTGASGVTILALGGLVLPALLKEGYPEGFSLGLVTASGSLGLLFPPSLPVILYAVVADTPIKELYIAGLVPGTFMVVLVAVYGVFAGIKAKVPRDRFEPAAAVRDLWRAKWDLGLPLVMMVAVISGFATIVEAAALAAAYALFVEIVVFRELRIGNPVAHVMGDAATLVGAVLILLGVALGLTSYLVDAQIPQALLGWVTTHIHSQATFLLALNGLLLVLGSVLEIYSAIVVLAPLIVPMGKAFGVEPLHLGVVFLANLELGFLFPPMGLNLFLAAQRFNKPLPVLYRRALPFLAIMTVGVLIITYVPAVTTGVVHAFGGK